MEPRCPPPIERPAPHAAPRWPSPRWRAAFRLSVHRLRVVRPAVFDDRDAPLRSRTDRARPVPDVRRLRRRVRRRGRPPLSCRGNRLSGLRTTRWRCCRATAAVVARREPALAAAAEALRGGDILALKGLGGYQLLTDATGEAAVARLRERKHRDEKPLALLVATIAEARRLLRRLQRGGGAARLARRTDRSAGPPAGRGGSRSRRTSRRASVASGSCCRARRCMISWPAPSAARWSAPAETARRSPSASTRPRRWRGWRGSPISGWRTIGRSFAPSTTRSRRSARAGRSSCAGRAATCRTRSRRRSCAGACSPSADSQKSTAALLADGRLIAGAARRRSAIAGGGGAPGTERGGSVRAGGRVARGRRLRRASRFRVDPARAALGRGARRPLIAVPAPSRPRRRVHRSSIGSRSRCWRSPGTARASATTGRSGAERHWSSTGLGLSATPTCDPSRCRAEPARCASRCAAGGARRAKRSGRRRTPGWPRSAREPQVVAGPRSRAPHPPSSAARAAWDGCSTASPRCSGPPPRDLRGPAAAMLLETRADEAHDDVASPIRSHSRRATSVAPRCSTGRRCCSAARGADRAAGTSAPVRGAFHATLAVAAVGAGRRRGPGPRRADRRLFPEPAPLPTGPCSTGAAGFSVHGRACCLPTTAGYRSGQAVVAACAWSAGAELNHVPRDSR